MQRGPIGRIASVFRRFPMRIPCEHVSEQEIPVFFDDVHGTPEYRKHLTLHFAEEIRRELDAK
jgi:hypothetical protein